MRAWKIEADSLKGATRKRKSKSWRSKSLQSLYNAKGTDTERIATTAGGPAALSKPKLRMNAAGSARCTTVRSLMQTESAVGIRLRAAASGSARLRGLSSARVETTD